LGVDDLQGFAAPVERLGQARERRRPGRAQRTRERRGQGHGQRRFKVGHQHRGGPRFGRHEQGAIGIGVQAGRVLRGEHRAADVLTDRRLQGVRVRRRNGGDGRARFR
jgi:hypothetical protein